MYENGKIKPVETMIYYKNFGKCHNVPQYNNKKR
jgi:hypothetical protein